MKAKRFLVVLVSLFLMTNQAGAQEVPSISFEELYKEHEFVFLSYDVTVDVKDDWSYTTREHKIVKIQKESAKNMGEIPLAYDKSQETVKVIKANTTTPDGVKHSYTKVQDMPQNSGYAMYSNDMVKTITMPEVNVGSLIEFEAVTSTKRDRIKGQFWFMTNTDSAAPIKDMNFEISFPKKAGMQYKDFNLTNKPEIRDDGKRITYSWRAKNVYSKPKSDQYRPLPTPENIMDAVEFSSIKDWKFISDWYYGLVVKNMRSNKEIQGVVRTAIEGKNSVRNKTRAILEYVQDNFRYVAMSFGDNGLEPHPTDEVFRNKYGDCKDLSLLCTLMLKEAGISSNIALFRNEYDISDPKYDLPMPTLFNHVLLEVEDPAGNFFIDPLLKGYDIGEYPLSYQGAYLFVINKDGGRFDRLPIFDEKYSYKRSECITTINPDGSAIVDNTSYWDLGESVDMRDKWKSMKEDDRKKFLQYLESSFTEGGTIIEHKFENIDARYGPISARFKYENPKGFQITDGMIMINMESFDGNSELPEKERDRPIFYPGNSLSEQVSTYNIPEGFKVSYLPPSVDLDIGILSYKRTYKREPCKVIVTEIERYRRKEIPVNEYLKVKRFFDELPSKTAQKIILKKVDKGFSFRLWLKNLLLRAAEKL